MKDNRKDRKASRSEKGLWRVGLRDVYKMRVRDQWRERERQNAELKWNH